jgi:hypothetical protein
MERARLAKETARLQMEREMLDRDLTRFQKMVGITEADSAVRGFEDKERKTKQRTVDILARESSLEREKPPLDFLRRHDEHEMASRMEGKKIHGVCLKCMDGMDFHVCRCDDCKGEGKGSVRGGSGIDWVVFEKRGEEGERADKDSGSFDMGAQAQVWDEEKDTGVFIDLEHDYDDDFTW